MNEQIATQDWYTRAIVRIKHNIRVHSPEGGYRDFQAGEEVEMLQWGRAGRPVERDSWWTSFDIDGAFILDPDDVDLLQVVDEVQP